MMGVRSAIAAIFVLTGFMSAPSSAQVDDRGVRHAAQCFILFSAMAGSQDPAAKSSGFIGGMFFAGQIFGGDPSVDLDSLLKSEALAMNEARAQQLLPQCGKEMQTRGAQITTAGKALQQIDPDGGKAR